MRTYYPYVLLYSTMRPEPIADVAGDPVYIDLSIDSPLLATIDTSDQLALQRCIDDDLGKHTWGISGYMERRDSLLAQSSQASERRFFHLGLDILVPPGTKLHAPIEGVVYDSGFEDGPRSYGGYVLLEHRSENSPVFYSLYGHLSPKSLPRRGERFGPGDVFSQVGEFHENGNWFYHTHLQVLTEEGMEAGFKEKGYCAKDDLYRINSLCPSPLPLFTPTRRRVFRQSFGRT